MPDYISLPCPPVPPLHLAVFDGRIRSRRHPRHETHTESVRETYAERKKNNNKRRRDRTDGHERCA